MAVTEAMDEKELADFDQRLNAKPQAARPSQGVEQLWGLMGMPGVAPGVAPGGVPRPARPAVPPRQQPVRLGRRIGETP